MLVNVRMLLAEPPRRGPRRIVRVTKDEPHTLVVKLGGASACLRFSETIVVADLLEYCENQLGWSVMALPFVVDGRRYGPNQAGTVELAPTTERVDVGQATRPSVLEVTRDVGSKG